MLHSYVVTLFVVFAGQQVRILGENFTLEDEEDSKIEQVAICC